jgi:hypothetical protein
MDCLADLIEHCGVQATYDLLYDGARLERASSGGISRAGSDAWRIVGTLPQHAGEGARVGSL